MIEQISINHVKKIKATIQHQLLIQHKLHKQ